MLHINHINNLKINSEMLIKYLIEYFINLRTVKNELAWKSDVDETITLISLPQAQMITCLYRQIYWILTFFLFCPHPQNLSLTFQTQITWVWICHQMWFKPWAPFFQELQIPREGFWIIDSDRGPMLFPAHAVIHATTEKLSLGSLEIHWITNAKRRLFFCCC